MSRLEIRLKTSCRATPRPAVVVGWNSETKGGAALHSWSWVSLLQVPLVSLPSGATSWLGAEQNPEGWSPCAKEPQEPRMGELGVPTWRREGSRKSLELLPVPEGLQESWRWSLDKAQGVSEGGMASH